MRGVPWHVKGVHPGARESAREAARRAGMSVGEWLNSVIVDQADTGAAPHSSDESGFDEHHVSSINERLDHLTAQLDRIAERGAGQQHKPARDHGHDRQLADAAARLDERLDHMPADARGRKSSSPGHGAANVGDALARLTDSRLRASFGGETLPKRPPSSVDQAADEIAARQRALDGDDAGPPPHAARLAASHRPFGMADVVDALRQDLGDIVRIVQDAMPRQAIETLEREVRSFGTKLDAGREAGADTPALSALDKGLAEVREALRGLAPAESLVGVDDAVRSLSQKIDKLAASGHDPLALPQLEAAIASLRGIVGHVASGDALSGLAAEVRGLTDKFEQQRALPANPAANEMLTTLERRIAGIAEQVERGNQNNNIDVLSILERRIADIAEQVERGNQNNNNKDALATLERRLGGIADALETRRAETGHAISPEVQTLVRSLTDKLDGLHLGKSDQLVLGHLEERIAKLVEKLDASEGRLGHLGGIERGMAELLVHLDELRGGNGARGAKPVADTVRPDRQDFERHDLEQQDLERQTLERQNLERQVATLAEAERLTKDSIEAAHSTIDQVVDRLATIETDLRSSAPAAVIRHAVGAPSAGEPRSPPRVSPNSPTMMASTSSTPPTSVTPARGPDPTRKRQPIDPNLPADAPLEPGSGAPRVRVIATAADRIAASEAALGGARIAAPGKAAANAIAAVGSVQAARRAAQTAVVEQQTQAQTRPKDVVEPGHTPSKSLGSRIKALLVGASVIAIIGGGARLAIDFIDTVHTDTGTPAPPAIERPATVPPRPLGLPNANVLLPDNGSLLAPPVVTPIPNLPPTLAPPPPAATDAKPPDTKSPDMKQPDPEPTGSVPARAAVGLPPPPPSSLAAKTISGEPLPASLGGPALLRAAAAGDAGAAFEIGTRYADGRPGMPANPQAASLWLERAAKAGITPAQFRLGGFYEKGIGVKKDLAEARQLYRAAADKGHAKAMHNLAVLYAEGVDGRPDYATAASWFRKAAEHGVADSQYNLAILYARGIGVDASMVESFKWFTLAAQSGDQDAAKKRDDVGARLDPASLTAAQQAVSSFAAQPQPDAAVGVKPPEGGWDQEAEAKPRPPRARMPGTKAATP